MKPSPSLLALVGVLALHLELPAQDTSRIFQEHAGSVFKVEVLEARSSTPYRIGTAFVADQGGILVTNYHVVNDLVFSPDRYTLRLSDTEGGRVEGVTVIGVDPAHDLAALRAPEVTALPLSLAEELPSVGTPVFSLGYPRDLTGTVVEGSFSGAMVNSFLGRYHFTGSLNAGMSGGPTLLADGRVVGVNVATSGNQLSYLVPLDPVRSLLESVPSPPEDVDLIAQATRALLSVQERLARAVLADGIGSAAFGGFELPTPGEELFACHSSPLNDDDVEYEGFVYRCDLDDHLFLDPDAALPILVFEHVVVSAPTLRPRRFAALLSTWHAQVWASEAPATDWATEYVCDQRNVRNRNGLPLRTVQCWRRRPDLDGLYDLFLRSTPLGRDRSGVVSTYLMFGATRENGVRLMEVVLDRVQIDP